MLKITVALLSLFREEQKYLLASSFSTVTLNGNSAAAELHSVSLKS